MEKKNHLGAKEVVSGTKYNWAILCCNYSTTKMFEACKKNAGEENP